MSSLLAGGEPPDLAAVLAAEGWAVARETPATLAARYGRDLSDPFPGSRGGDPASGPPWLDTEFLSASRALSRRPATAG